MSSETKSEGCKFCKNWSVEDIPIKSNADLRKVFAMIAQGDRKKEIILHVNGAAYGIEIAFCPICGAKLNGMKE